MLELYVSESIVASPRAGSTRIMTDVSNFEVALEHSLADVATRHRWLPTKRARVWLSASLARPFVVDKVHGLKSFAEARHVAIAVAPAATGLDGVPAVWLEAVPNSRSVLAIAVPQRTVDALRSALARRGFALASLRPYWAKALDICLKRFSDAALVCVDEPDGLTVLAGPESGIVFASTSVPKPDGVERIAMMRRLSIAHAISLNKAVIGELDLVRLHEKSAGLAWSRLDRV